MFSMFSSVQGSKISDLMMIGSMLTGTTPQRGKTETEQTINQNAAAVKKSLNSEERIRPYRRSDYAGKDMALFCPIFFHQYSLCRILTGNG